MIRLSDSDRHMEDPEQHAVRSTTTLNVSSSVRIINFESSPGLPKAAALEEARCHMLTLLKEMMGAGTSGGGAESSAAGGEEQEDGEDDECASGSGEEELFSKLESERRKRGSTSTAG
eukprot:GHVU01115631.1.p4 GENE.GHVU01115631.1~~GHVU01115631.1.p4  ORF type:complete len:118 (+),score=25.07 GHVU01115631.1:208-561(+)